MALNYRPSKAQAGNGFRDASGETYVAHTDDSLRRLTPKIKRAKKERTKAKRAAKRNRV